MMWAKLEGDKPDEEKITELISESHKNRQWSATTLILKIINTIFIISFMEFRNRIEHWHIFCTFHIFFSQVSKGFDDLKKEWFPLFQFESGYPWFFFSIKTLFLTPILFQYHWKYNFLFPYVWLKNPFLRCDLENNFNIESFL